MTFGIGQISNANDDLEGSRPKLAALGDLLYANTAGTSGALAGLLPCNAADVSMHAHIKENHEGAAARMWAASCGRLK